MSKAELERAVRSWQLYDGSLSGTTVRVQQKLYDRAMSKSRAIAKKTGYDLNKVVEELTRTASSRGRISPRPGQDY